MSEFDHSSLPLDLLQQILEIVPEAVVSVDEAQRIVLFSRGAERLFDYDRSEVVGRPLDVLIPEACRAVHRTFVAQFDTAPEVARLMGARGIIAYRRRDGALLPAEASIAKVSLRGHRFFVAVLRDATERSAAEQALQGLAGELSQLSGEAFVAGVVRLVAQTLGAEYVLIGRAIEGEQNRVRVVASSDPRGDLQGKEYRLTGTPCEKVLRTGQLCVYRDELRVLFPADPRVTAWGIVAYAGAPILNPAGVVVGLIAVMGRAPLALPRLAEALLPVAATRIAAEWGRQELEDALLRERQYFEDLFEHAPEAIALVGERRRVVRVNEEFLRLFGYRREEVTGRPIDALVIPESRADEFHMIEEHLAAGRTVHVETVRRRRDGTLVPVLMLARRVQLGGRDLGVLAMYRDLTDRRELEQRAVQAEKIETLGRLTAGVAHDFNNLLTAILGYAQWIGEHLGQTHPLYSDVRQVQAAAERGAQLTHQLLAFGRKQLLRPVPLNINRAVGDSEALLRRVVPESVRLVLELDNALGTVRVDPVRLQQVILNLVTNACDAMPRGGTLRLRTWNAVGPVPCVDRTHEQDDRGPYVALEVTDTGVGMDPTTMSRIFEPFFTTKERGKGTGLGLATVYGIVKQSGGHIEVASVPGQGSRFVIYFPQVDEAPTTTAPPPQGRPPAPEVQDGATVLLVEDDAGVRKIARCTLERRGYRVLEAADPKEALALVERQGGSIALLLSDVVMPGMSGCDLAAEVRRRCPAVRVLLMSGYAEGVRTGPLAESAPVILEKPFSPEALLSKVREALDPRREG